MFESRKRLNFELYRLLKYVYDVEEQRIYLYMLYVTNFIYVCIHRPRYMLYVHMYVVM